MNVNVFDGIQIRMTEKHSLLNALIGDEDEAYEFRMMFADLCAECDRMESDLKEEWVPECFDIFFVSAGAADDFGGLLGFDSYEQDYFGISPYESFCGRRSKKEIDENDERRSYYFRKAML